MNKSGAEVYAKCTAAFLLLQWTVNSATACRQSSGLSLESSQATSRGEDTPGFPASMTTDAAAVYVQSTSCGYGVTCLALCMLQAPVRIMKGS